MTLKRAMVYKVVTPLLLLVVAFCPLNAAKLLDISVSSIQGGSQITASFDNPVNYTEFAMENKIIFDILETENGMEANRFEGIDRGGVGSITLIPFYTANLLRFTVEMSAPGTYAATTEGNDLIIKFDYAGYGPFETWVASQQEVTETSLEYEQYYDVPGLISLDLENADIQTILRAMAHYGGKNVVAGQEVKGTITMKLTNVSWKQAFDVIVKTAGFAYREEGAIIRVAEGTTFDKEREAAEMAEPVVHKVYKLSFAEPGELKTNLEKLLSRKGVIEVDNRTNSIVVTDIESKHIYIEELLRILDSPNPQVDIEVRVVDIDYAFGRDLGISWSISNLRSTRYNTYAAGTLSAPAAAPLDISIGTIRNFAQINAILNISENEGKTKTIANPRITALNNREAEILGGKKFPVNVLDQAGNLVTRYFEVGTYLKVTPHINSKDEITMDIQAELSNVDPTTLIITTTEATTRQLVKDGETVVLGGFIREEEQSSEVGIPILRHIPLLGFLFKRAGKSSTKREVLIFLTPHIIKYY
jgi:type IV pilus assembly protein PilQ